MIPRMAHFTVDRMTISRLKREMLWPKLRLNTPGNFMKRIRLDSKTPDPAAKKPRHAKLDDVRIDGVRRAREAVTHNLGLYGSGDPGPLILSASGNGFSADLRDEINTRYPGQVHVSPSFPLGPVVLYIRKYESGLPMVDFLSTRRPTTTD